ncbi:MAG: NADP-dependent oxidoreductase [SAR86 cluster bacterium]|uniref:NADP-dependent oxidoreductase n=1 Tax=SAR86 cluster bacterium TaxID=2030880 RepID=A0A972VX92_9GAMM|nr:NADP-dependent oxidoreductase [SAR86 cluster bacterium]
MTINRQWLLAARPAGMIGPQNFEYAESPIPTLSAGEVLVKNLFLSFDPTQRNWMVDRPGYLPPVGMGETMRAGSVGQVVDSQHDDFAVGELVQTTGGWQDYAVVAPGQGPMGLTKLPAGVSPEMMLSILGITGLTAYFGLLDIGLPKAGETVLVSGAAGATGSIVGQIAKLKGCRVVGIAGGPEKCRWLKEQAGFDAVIDYKNADVNAQIALHCPEKWDVFFDNVGGDILEAALNHLNLHSRIVMCGGISGYNATDPVPGPANLMNLITNRGRMQGFIILDYLPRAMEAIHELMAWVAAGDIIYQVDLKEGFENIPSTLQRLYTGQNVGKQLLKIANPV